MTREGWHRLYSAQVLDYWTENAGWQQHLIIKRRDEEEIRATWSELQTIKDEILGADVRVVEIYPEEGAVVNEVNWRHFWTVNPGQIQSAFDLRLAPPDVIEEMKRKGLR
jgi:hypothetical protein